MKYQITIIVWFFQLLSTSVFARPDCPSKSTAHEQFIFAVKSDDLKKVKLLKSCPGVEINFSGGQSNPLLVSIFNKSSQVMNYLVSDSQINVNEVATNYDYSLKYSIVELYLDKAYKNQDYSYDDPYLASVVLALNKRPDFDPNFSSASANYKHTPPIIKAAQIGFTETVQALLQNPKIDINAREFFGYSGLQGKGIIAATLYEGINNSCEIINFVLKKPNFDLNSLNHARHSGTRDVNEIEDIVGLQKMYNLREYNISDQTLRCFSNILRDIYLDPRFRVNQKEGTRGLTSAMILSFYGLNDSLRIILSRPDTDINVCSNDKLSALDYAVKNNQSDTVEILKSFGAKSCIQ